MMQLGIQIKNGFVTSPFNKGEKTPSCKIYANNNYFHDFSTGNGGDVIDFYAAYYNVSKKDSVRDLAKIAGVVPGEFISRVPTRSNEAEKKSDTGLTDKERERFDDYAKHIGEAKALRFVKLERVDENSGVFSNLYEYCRNDWDANIICYLRDQRGFTDETIKRFKLFCINNYFEVNNHLKKTFPEDRLKRCGLFNDKGNLIFALHRLIIPYLWEGQIVYLRGRYFDKDGQTKTENGSKYIGLRNDAMNVNSPKRFFNGDILKTMLLGETVYITEGEFDSIVIEQMGFNAVAVPGAGNLPKEDKLKRLSKLNVVYCGDNDTAGQGLLQRLELALQKNIIVKKFDKKDINDWYVGQKKLVAV